MTQIMTVTEITDDQIESAVNKLRDEMRKHRYEITSDIAQQVFGFENLVMMMFTPFHERAKAVSKLIVRKVLVNRGRSPRKALKATNRTQYTNRKVVDSMPRGEGKEVDIVFFEPDLSKCNGFISNDDLEKKLELLNLKPADPISVIAVDEVEPAFADNNPHGTFWKDAEGNWCCATFYLWNGKRCVNVNRAIGGWHNTSVSASGSWIFACQQASSSQRQVSLDSGH